MSKYYMFLKFEDFHTDLIGIFINSILCFKEFLKINCDVRNFIKLYENSSEVLNRIKNEKIYDIGLIYFLFFRNNNNSSKSESELYIRRRDFALNICDYVKFNKEKLTDNIYEMYECIDNDMNNLIKNTEHYNFDLTYEEFVELCDNLNKKLNSFNQNEISQNKINHNETYKKIYDYLKNINSNKIKLCIKHILLFVFNISFNLKRKLKLNTYEDDIIHNKIQLMCFENTEYFEIIMRPNKLIYSYNYKDYLKYINYVKENFDPNVVIQNEFNQLDELDELDEEFNSDELDESKNNKENSFNIFNYFLNNNQGKTNDNENSQTLYDKYNVYYSYIKYLYKNDNDIMFLFDDNITKNIKIINKNNRV